MSNLDMNEPKAPGSVTFVNFASIGVLKEIDELNACESLLVFILIYFP